MQVILPVTRCLLLSVGPRSYQDHKEGFPCSHREIVSFGPCLCRWPDGVDTLRLVIPASPSTSTRTSGLSMKLSVQLIARSYNSLMRCTLGCRSLKTPAQQDIWVYNPLDEANPARSGPRHFFQASRGGTRAEGQLCSRSLCPRHNRIGRSCCRP
jgi:hypothetical protein